MRICDRCRKPNPKYHNYYIANEGRDLCEKCHKDYDELQEVFESMQRDFMNNKNLKHIDFQWEDAR